MRERGRTREGGQERKERDGGRQREEERGRIKEGE